MKFAVTTGRNCRQVIEDKAKIWARQLGAPYLPRGKYKNLALLQKDLKLDAVVVATADGPQLVTKDDVFFYHPGMAVLRLQKLKRGEGDHLLGALAVQEGSRVLDATLGLASDAAIACYFVGRSGKVIGLEASRLLWFVVSQGLKTYEAEDNDLTLALRRIETVQTDAQKYLAACAEDSFDVVYFDPMFRHPVQDSAAMRALRPWAYGQPLNEATVNLALKAAPRVVIKERSEKILAEYGCQEILGGRYSKVKYGIIRRC